jgi:flagellar basal-body rod protein FlgF
MDSLSISAASGMRARMESLEMLANNLANIETGGFKADREFYSIYIGDDATAKPNSDDLTAQPVIESQWTDHSQGNLRNTSNPMDFAIDGAGFFPIQTATGVKYTRNGSFRLSPAGLLTTSEGNPVVGKNGLPIPLQSNMPVEVTEDGTVSQGGQPVGQFELVSFDANTIQKAGTNSFVPLDGVKPKPANGVIQQGKLEQSNVGAAESSVRLVAIMRQFEMLQKAMNLGNELNRRAIEEVARVAA